jgi:predicted DNA binding CopG/RHH family protein
MKTIETAEELDAIKGVEDGNYTSLKDDELKDMTKMLKDAATNTTNRLSKKKSISIRVVEDDIQRLKAKALHLGMPYQTLISSIIHQYTHGELESKIV